MDDTARQSAQVFRLLWEREAQSGAWNMAVDEVLLESALERGVCTVRLYRWAEPTVSLGYFQKPEEAEADPRFRGLAVVRRLSGGGAILHHHEWTYSLALPPGHPLGRRPLDVYAVAHAAVVGWLNANGVPAAMRRDVIRFPENGRASALGDVLEGGSGAGRTDRVASENSSVERRALEPFLCFGRGDPHDVVLFGQKILGSAQRRRRGAILQHGSLLTRVSPYAAEFPGLIELSGRAELEDGFPPAFVARFGPALGVPNGETFLGKAETDSANLLVSTRYSRNRDPAD